MRRLRYGVAMSLDGFIAGPNGEYDWIAPNAGIDFVSIFAQFDILLMGRKTYEVARSGRNPNAPGQKWVVVSSKLDPEQHPGVTILNGNIRDQVAVLKAQPGKDIWLMGGGVLFRTLVDAGLVDAIELAVFPVLLGSGVPLLPEGKREQLRIESCKSLASGVVMLAYSVLRTIS